MKCWTLFFSSLLLFKVITASKNSITNEKDDNSVVVVSSDGVKKEDYEWFVSKQQKNETGIFQTSKFHVLRLGPGEDLLESLWKYARVTKIKAASIVSTVGSLQKTNIRYSNAQVGTVIEDYFEIVSLVGNIDLQYSKDSAYPSSMGTKSGSGHVHISLSDANGNTIGGHLLSGNIVYTTAEITLVELPNAVFTREMDEKPEGSGYYELKVHTIKP